MMNKKCLILSNKIQDLQGVTQYLSVVHLVYIVRKKVPIMGREKGRDRENREKATIISFVYSFTVITDPKTQ